MRNPLLWIALSGASLFVITGFGVLWTHFNRKKLWRQVGLTLLTLLGPITLGICWKAQIQMMEADTVLWARLMSGDVSKIWAIGSLGLIAGSGLALGALSLQSKIRGIFLGAIALGLMWIVLYLHPTPHYVPMPAWLDKLVWFVLLVGGAVLCLIIYVKYQQHLQLFQVPVILIAGIVPILAIGYPLAVGEVFRTPDLAPLQPQERIQVMGCLSCHSIGESGYPLPGGGLESVASRKEDAVMAFLAEPSAENAKNMASAKIPVER